MQVFYSPEYKEHVVPDEAKFFDRENSPVLPIKLSLSSTSSEQGGVFARSLVLCIVADGWQPAI